VLDKGLSEHEVSCIMVVQGSFFGMGYLPKNLEGLSKKNIEEYIKPYKENSYIRTLLMSHVSNFPTQIKALEE
jgi:DNA polymerase-3 subunit epsilon